MLLRVFFFYFENNSAGRGHSKLQTQGLGFLSTTMKPAPNIDLKKLKSHFQSVRNRMKAYAAQPSSELQPDIFNVSSLIIRTPEQHIQHLIQTKLKEWNAEEQTMNNDVHENISLETKYKAMVPSYNDVETEILELGNSNSATFRACLNGDPISNEAAAIQSNIITKMARCNHRCNSVKRANLIDSNVIDSSKQTDLFSNIQEETMLVEIHVYKAHRTGHETNTSPISIDTAGKELVLSQILLFREDQTLDELYDAIYCLCNMYPDVSPSSDSAAAAGGATVTQDYHFYDNINYGNVFFYIENTFYTDHINPPSHSFVQCIHKQQKEHYLKHQESSSSTSSSSTSSSSTSFSSSTFSSSSSTSSSSSSTPTSSTSTTLPDYLVSQQYHTELSNLSTMKSTKLKDLYNLQLGKPYLFCHSGGCEHIISFVDIRSSKISTEPDESNESSSSSSTNSSSKSTSPYFTPVPSWPKQLYRRSLKRKRCNVCSPYDTRKPWINRKCANFVLYNHPLLDRSPSFFCEECYELFHYDKDGELLIQEEFRVYPYYHDL